MTDPDTILILAAHGSSHPGARGALEGFAQRVRREHPRLRVQLAHTALRRYGGHPALDAGSGLEEVLAGLNGPGPLRVLVQSLHVIAGEEFDRMREVLEGFAAARGAALTVSAPLLSGAGDAPPVARALADSLLVPAGRPLPERAFPASKCRGASEAPCAPNQGEAVVLMGHGTTHAAQELYLHLADSLENSLPWARLGVLEAADPGDPLSIHAIAMDLVAKGVRRASLIPFLTVAGRHAHKDLAGDQPGSWKSVLAEHGIKCAPELAGLIEREAFARLWLESLASLLAD